MYWGAAAADCQESHCLSKSTQKSLPLLQETLKNKMSLIFQCPDGITVIERPVSVTENMYEVKAGFFAHAKKMVSSLPGVCSGLTDVMAYRSELLSRRDLENADSEQRSCRLYL